MASTILLPREAPVHTIIWLHGRDSFAAEFSNEFFESEASQLEEPSRAHQVLYPDSYCPRSSLYPDTYCPGRPPYFRNRPYGSDMFLDVLLYSLLDACDSDHWAVYVRSPRGRGSVHQVHDDVGGVGYYVAPLHWDVVLSRARQFTEGIYVGRIRRLNLHWARCIMETW
ncbi:hypothetical protein M426DRAFT_11015 [Hypoxylon sp. CI-4A]|nr:hypothetical protein M426DRAFT_11015 [Hypoxylon sp. CI-4A]